MKLSQAKVLKPGDIVLAHNGECYYSQAAVQSWEQMTPKKVVVGIEFTEGPVKGLQCTRSHTSLFIPKRK